MFFNLVFDLVYEFLHLVLLQADAFFFENLHDFGAGVFSFFRSDEKTDCGACYGTSDY